VPNSSATRFNELAQAISKLRGSDPAMQIWPMVVDVSEFEGWRKNVEVARMVGVCRRQVDELRRDLTRVPQGKKYEWILKPLEGMFSFNEPGGRWDSTVSAHVDARLLATLEALGDFLPETTGEIPQEVLKSARLLVAQIRKAVVGADLPDAVREFLLDQVELMERGFREYPLTGPAAFGVARQEATSRWFGAPAALLPYQDVRVVRKIGVGWRRLERLADACTVALAMGTFAPWGVRVAERFDLFPAAVVQAIEPFLDPASPPHALLVPKDHRLLMPGDTVPLSANDGPALPDDDRVPPSGDGQSAPDGHHDPHSGERPPRPHAELLPSPEPTHASPPAASEA